MAHTYKALVPTVQSRDCFAALYNMPLSNLSKAGSSKGILMPLESWSLELGPLYIPPWRQPVLGNALRIETGRAPTHPTAWYVKFPGMHGQCLAHSRPRSCGAWDRLLQSTSGQLLHSESSDADPWWATDYSLA